MCHTQIGIAKDHMASPSVQRLRAKLEARTLNDWQTFHEEVRRRLRPRMTVLDLGCGDGISCPFPWDEFPDVYRIGLDVDVAAKQNPHMHEIHLIKDGKDWPIGDSTIDLVTSRYVLEHVASPMPLLANVHRVLRPGGIFCFLTPNKYSLEMIASNILPHAIKTKLLDRCVGGDHPGGFFTYYRLNTRRAIERAARKSGLEVEQINVGQYITSRYFDFSLATFFVAHAYATAIMKTRLERFIGGSIIGVLRRPDSSA